MSSYASAKKTLVPMIVAIIVFSVALYFAKDKLWNGMNNSGMLPLVDGELTVNTNKQEFILGETVWIEIYSMTFGETISCSNDIEVKLFGPDGFGDKVFSVKDGSIEALGNCGKTSSDPTHRLRFVANKSGRYIIRATDLSSNKSYEGTISVGEKGNFSIERSGAGSIVSSSSARYHMILRVTAEREFKGQVVDVVPKPFNLIWKGNASVDNEKVSWDVDLAPGETKELIYEFSVPEAEAGVYFLGKAYLVEDGNIVYVEGRRWQVLVGVVDE